jgi:hypothetical protein
MNIPNLHLDKFLSKSPKKRGIVKSTPRVTIPLSDEEKTNLAVSFIKMYMKRKHFKKKSKIPNPFFSFKSKKTQIDYFKK